MTKRSTNASRLLVETKESASTRSAGSLAIAPSGGMETFVSRMSMNACGRCLAITMQPAKTQTAISNASVCKATKEKGNQSF